MIDLTQKAVHVINNMLGGKKEFGLRLKTVDDCCGIKLNLSFDKKTKSDRTIKKHENIRIFADKLTLQTIDFLIKKKEFSKTVVDYISTPVAKGFVSGNNRLNINIWEHELI